MSVLSLGIQHLALRSAEDVHDIFRRLGYDVYSPDSFEGNDLDQLELDEVDRDTVQRAYVVARHDNHTVYLYEVNDLKGTRLRGLAWNALQRGTALLAVTRDYREVVFVDPRFVGKPNKSSVRVNKLKVITSDPTRHDLDTLNAIHAHRRSGQQVYDAQAGAFNVNTITKKFYDEYRRHYEHARAMARHYNPGIREFQNEAESDKLHAFTQRLLGRLMFLYFLQRKGWLGGRGRFLTEKYIETMRHHSDEVSGDAETFYFYREVLEPLFFQTMNTKRPDDITIWGGIRIPYLNGGLFDEGRDPQGPIVLPDSLFDPNSDEGLLAFFNRYNFTIADDTPLEQDVAVDPEMLGKVFENLLEERDRGQSGSFYTPRAIVSYMCQEALAGYLEESAGVPRETTRAQFDPDSQQRFTPEEAERVNAALDTMTALDPAVGSGSFLIGMLNEIVRLRKAAWIVLVKQEETTNITTEITEIPAQVVADWKEAIIRDTLYGVDIKPEAIEIAQLRLWLALVVDQTLEQARPLPNLDYKLMAGNSLIETIDGEPVLGEFAASILQPKDGVQWEHVRQQLQMFDPNPVQGRMLLFDEEKQVQQERIKLDELRREFFRATPDERRRLRDEISTQERRIVYASLSEKAEKLQAQIDHYGKLAANAGGRLKATDERKLNAAVDKLARLTQLQEDMRKPDYAPPFFLYHLHFSEVFERKGGFDIVIANPPYVRYQSIPTSLKRELALTYPDYYSGQADLFVYFFARAAELVRRKGMMTVITSNKYLRAGYGSGLRKNLRDNTKIEFMIDFGDMSLFDATAYPSIIQTQLQPSHQNVIRILYQPDEIALVDLNQAFVTQGFEIEQGSLPEFGWNLSGGNIQKLLDKLRLSGEPLGDVISDEFYTGLNTGLNEAYVITEAQREEFIRKDSQCDHLIKRWIRGRDVDRWIAEWSGQYIILAAIGIDLEKYPVLLEHMMQFRDRLSQRSDYKPNRMQWYHLRACSYYDTFEKPKILYPDIAVQPRFTLDTSGSYADFSAFFIAGDSLYILGILNSSLTGFFLKQTSSTIRGGFVRLKKIYLEQLPIPDPPADLREKIAGLARRCLEAAKSAPESLPALEADLNALVYQAYGLDADDIRVIEGYLAGKGTGGQNKEALETDELDEG